jgi:DNA-binding Xre family transcriptional regulator
MVLFLMFQTLIKWRLREVMARYRIKAKDLAKELGISSNAVSNLRLSESMPRLDGDSLNNLCNALNKLALGLEYEITPMTLIDYTRDDEPDNSPPLPKSSFTKNNQPSQKDSEKPPKRSRSTMLVIPDITEGPLSGQLPLFPGTTKADEKAA